MSSSKMRTCAPASSGAQNCQMQMSKVAAASCETLSRGPIARSSILASMWLTMPPCSIITPLGSPVEPDVKIM